MRYLVTTEALTSGIRPTTSTGPGLDRPSIASWTPEHQPAWTSALDADYRVWPTRSGSPRAIRRYERTFALTNGCPAARGRRAFIADHDDGRARARGEMGGEHGLAGHRVGMPAELLCVGQAAGLQAGQAERQDAEDHGGGDPYPARLGGDGPADAGLHSPVGRLGRAVDGPVGPEDPAREGHHQGGQQGEHGKQAAALARSAAVRPEART